MKRKAITIRRALRLLRRAALALGGAAVFVLSFWLAWALSPALGIPM